MSAGSPGAGFWKVRDVVDNGQVSKQLALITKLDIQAPPFLLSRLK